jgi:hypothetical protein
LDTAELPLGTSSSFRLLVVNSRAVFGRTVQVRGPARVVMLGRCGGARVAAMATVHEQHRRRADERRPEDHHAPGRYPESHYRDDRRQDGHDQAGSDPRPWLSCHIAPFVGVCVGASPLRVKGT